MKQSYFEPRPLFDSIIRPQMPEGSEVRSFYASSPFICVEFAAPENKYGVALFSDSGSLWGINWWAEPPPYWGAK